jgi:glycosyltransferase involved in cell wall biosynthesis
MLTESITGEDRPTVDNPIFRLAIIATHPIQYQVPIWRALSREANLEVRVYYASDSSVRGYLDRGFGVVVKWDVPLTEGYVHTFLATNRQQNSSNAFFTLRAINLRRHLKDFRPNAILIGAYTPFFYLEALWIARSLAIPVFIRAETTDVAKPHPAIKQCIRSILLRLLYSQCDYFLAIGKNSRAHYERLGIAPDLIGRSPLCVDTDLMAKQIRIYGPQRAKVRSDFGFDDVKTVFVFSGKLVPKKDPLTVARALQLIPDDERAQIGLIVLGDGELRASLESLCLATIGQRAVFVGFVNQSEIGRFYAASDALILPSVRGETWGLVVNEAMQFGLPVIVSDRVGCYPDLVVEGRTGFLFPAGNADKLKDQMLRIARASDDTRAAFSRECRNHISDYSLRESVTGIVRATKR